ncbi:hypothetical protein [Mycobacterium colombiense]|uniref:Uncharacterized protein n=1 Tax=Mycobacterium colombiense TaxID=339268 RepID=A0A1A2YNA2_9MYCO|nr:hypothetical protein [Mycobacterium colombiense]OBI39699.1 hypothetical protein A5708_02915 [Mycobacterium colombiense]
MASGRSSPTCGAQTAACPPTSRPDSHGRPRCGVRTALHIPANAGEHAAAIEAILRRVPDGWGRWLSVDAGWYPLVIATDRRLAEIDPGYVVHQIKEKFGTLRYYCAAGSDDPRREVLDALDAVTEEAERFSALTCERCGDPGILRRTRYWAKTLCTPCGDGLGYMPASDWVQ